MQLQPNTLLQGGKYRIEKVLGQGGFGITYLAWNTMLEGKVAIKEFFFREYCERDVSTKHVTITTTSNHEMVERFKQKFIKEARNIFKLSHPNIVRILDIFEENGTAYYVMEYAEGGSLADKVKRQGSLPEPVAKRYIRQVANALNYVHNRKMNHLDVKPANIMIDMTDAKDEAVLIDFGLSKQYDIATGNQTSTTPVGISEGYAPMEQYKQGGVREFSPETDIYSLGATLFKILTGVTPPSASDINEDGVPVNELEAKGVSPSTINAICKAMEPRKRDRLTSMAAFLALLTDDAPVRPSIAPTPVPTYGEATVLKVDTHPADEEARAAAERGGTQSTSQSNNEEDNTNKGMLVFAILIFVVLSIVLMSQCHSCRSNGSAVDSVCADSFAYVYDEYEDSTAAWEEAYEYGDSVVWEEAPEP